MHWRKMTRTVQWHNTFLNDLHKEDQYTNHPKSSKIIRNHPKSSEIIRNHPKSSEITRIHLKSPEIIRNYPKSSEIIGNQPKSSEITRNHPKSPEIIRNQHFSPTAQRPVCRASSEWLNNPHHQQFARSTVVRSSTSDSRWDHVSVVVDVRSSGFVGTSWGTFLPPLYPSIPPSPDGRRVNN